MPSRRLFGLVRRRGLEPLCLAAQAPQACASANFATSAGEPSKYIKGLASSVVSRPLLRIRARLSVVPQKVGEESGFSPPPSLPTLRNETAVPHPIRALVSCGLGGIPRTPAICFLLDPAPFRAVSLADTDPSSTASSPSFDRIPRATSPIPPPHPLDEGGRRAGTSQGCGKAACPRFVTGHDY